jgi:phosphoglycerol transferase
MDPDYMQDVSENYTRTIYNCFINAATEPVGSVYNRTFTGFDLFPTTLAAMGFTIEGDRLGLGVNLFSNLPTLAETLGYKELEAEINKHSDYYLDEFT